MQMIEILGKNIKTAITRDKEGHYILIKGSIHQEAITSINIYATGIRAPNI